MSTDGKTIEGPYSLNGANEIIAYFKDERNNAELEAKGEPSYVEIGEPLHYRTRKMVQGLTDVLSAPRRNWLYFGVKFDERADEWHATDGKEVRVFKKEKQAQEFCGFKEAVKALKKAHEDGRADAQAAEPLKKGDTQALVEMIAELRGQVADMKKQLDEQEKGNKTE